ncbi:acyl-CoA dehydrogenase [Micromonospora sp. NPDC050686]|uniref:acyl-CoA dehydrogenase family protein n=1 Tax=Micromonospora sp. NPDC050686 TaxID=3154631 RepID=UPI00340FDADF
MTVMTVLKHKPDALRGLFGEYAGEIRRNALPLHNGDIAVEELAASVDPRLLRAGFPPEFNDDPMTVNGKPVHMRSFAEFVVAQEELAWADAGFLLSLPWSSMSTYLIEVLFDPQERDEFYATVAHKPRWVFFAVTEPAHGSDPLGMETTLSADGDSFRLNGTKRYIGNGARGFVGFVFCRRAGATGPLGIEAVRVRAGADGFDAEQLHTIGLRGAGLSELRFDNVKVTEDDIIGRRHSSVRRGFHGAVTTFDLFRPGVGAMALGIARAAYDYVRGERRNPGPVDAATLESLNDRIHSVRALIHGAARSIDAGKGNGSLSSAAKVAAVRLAEDSTRTLLRMLGPTARFDHPLMDKFDRDARGFEFMEGMSDIQRQRIAQGFLSRRFWPSEEPAP